MKSANMDKNQSLENLIHVRVYHLERYMKSIQELPVGFVNQGFVNQYFPQEEVRKKQDFIILCRIENEMRELLDLPTKEPQEYETSDFFRFYRINLQNQLANLPACIRLLMQRSAAEKSEKDFNFFTETDKFHIQSWIDSVNKTIVQQMVL